MSLAQGKRAWILVEQTRARFRTFAEAITKLLRSDLKMQYMIMCEGANNFAVALKVEKWRVCWNPTMSSFDVLAFSRAEEIARRFHPSVQRHYESCLPTSEDCFELPDIGFNSEVPMFTGNNTAASSADLHFLGNMFAAQCSCKQ
jgi:hypothetical protein